MPQINSITKNPKPNNKNKTKLTLLAPEPIEMIDHMSLAISAPQSSSSSSSGGGGDVHSQRTWCKNVMIGEYTIITGTNNVRFIVWTITIETVKNSKITIRKRYRDFVNLRNYLLAKYPRSAIEIPQLPTKSVLMNFDPKFLEKRRNGLEFFISSILLNPWFGSDEQVKLFVLN